MKIREIILTMGMVIFLAGNTNDVFSQSGKVGFRFMPTFTSFEVTTPDDETLKGEFTLGYGFGGVLGFFVSDHVGFQGEVIYSTLTQEYSKNEYEGEVELKYINIPLLISFNTGWQEDFNFNLVLGPQIGLNLGSDVDQTGDNTYEALVTVKKSDLGIAYGAGIDFGLNEDNTFRMDIGYRGVFGLIDISDDSGTQQTDSYYVLRKTNLNTYAGYIGLSYLF